MGFLRRINVEMDNLGFYLRVFLPSCLTKKAQAHKIIRDTINKLTTKKKSVSLQN